MQPFIGNGDSSYMSEWDILEIDTKQQTINQSSVLRYFDFYYVSLAMVKDCTFIEGMTVNVLQIYKMAFFYLFRHVDTPQ